MHQITERTYQLIHQAEEQVTVIIPSIDKLQTEPLPLKLQYLSEIKSITTSIQILLVDWNTFKARIFVTAPAILKACAFEGSSTEPSS